MTISRRALALSLLCAGASASACDVAEPLDPLGSGGGTTSSSDTSTSSSSTSTIPSEGGGGTGGAGGGAPIQGAIVDVAFSTEVAVLLDGLPPAIADRVADLAITEGEAAWLARAARHVERVDAMLRVLDHPVGLPPREVWLISLDPRGPARSTIGGHDVVSWPYSFHGTLVTTEGSPAERSPMLAMIGGAWQRTVIPPIDPDLVETRLGDQCTTPSGNPVPFYACPIAVDSIIGSVAAPVVFTRMPWDLGVAEAARVGEITFAHGAELALVAKNMEDAAVVHRYFAADSCAVAEGCVGAPGWRRVIAFTATVVNAGGRALEVGEPNGGPFFDHHLFTWSPCHMHYHFRNYGIFSFGSTEGEKRAFCLVSSSRRMNLPSVELTTPYDSCAFQGIAPGWADDYAAGIGCQWMDVTDVDPVPAGVTGALAFTVNPNGYLCEGKPILDANGAPQFEPTGDVDENGDPIDRPACDRAPGWSANNVGITSVTLDPKGNAVTSPCAFAVYDGRRDCMFAEASMPFACSPGEIVTLTCSVADPDAPQAVRACETSQTLGTAIPCRARDAAGSAIVDAGGTSLSVVCPEPRGADEPGGAFVLYSAPLVPQDPAVPVLCFP